MKKSKTFNSILAVATLCAVSVGSSVAMAQELSTDQPSTQQPSDTTTTPGHVTSVSKCTQLIGTTVKNQQGKTLGKIDDVVVSFDTEKVSYCVLRVKPGIFARTRYVAVPLAAFQPSDDGSHLILNANKSNLAQAGETDRNDWPSTITPAWGAEPAPAQELPPVAVFAPVVPPAPTAGYPWAADPAMGPPPARQYQSITRSTEAFQFQLAFGDVLSGH